jgi:cathepsin L
VLAVGYGTDAETGLDYWLIKNAWSDKWGDKGFIKIAIVEGEGICGVQKIPVIVNTN